MRLGIPRLCQGQTVELAFGWYDGEFYRRTFDWSDRTTAWHCAVDASEVPDSYDAGGANHPPPVTEWEACEAPKGAVR